MYSQGRNRTYLRDHNHLSSLWSRTLNINFFACFWKIESSSQKWWEFLLPAKASGHAVKNRVWPTHLLVSLDPVQKIHTIRTIPDKSEMSIFAKLHSFSSAMSHVSRPENWTPVNFSMEFNQLLTDSHTSIPRYSACWNNDNPDESVMSKVTPNYTSFGDTMRQISRTTTRELGQLITITVSSLC